MLAKPSQMSAVDPAKQVQIALEETLPRSICKLAEALSSQHEKRVALQDALDALQAQKLAVPGSRETELDEKIRDAHKKLRDFDAFIGAEAAKLHHARAGFEIEHAAAVKRVIAASGIVPDLVRAINAIDSARSIFTGVRRHCARHGLSAPDYLSALPQIEFLRKMMARLSS